MSPQKLVKEIDKRLKGLGKERDKIDDLLAEVQQMQDTNDRAIEGLNNARDALSEMI